MDNFSETIGSKMPLKNNDRLSSLWLENNTNCLLFLNNILCKWRKYYYEAILYNSKRKAIIHERAGANYRGACFTLSRNIIPFIKKFHHKKCLALRFAVPGQNYEYSRTARLYEVRTMKKFREKILNKNWKFFKTSERERPCSKRTWTSSIFR